MFLIVHGRRAPLSACHATPQVCSHPFNPPTHRHHHRGRRCPPGSGGFSQRLRLLSSASHGGGRLAVVRRLLAGSLEASWENLCCSRLLGVSFGPQALHGFTRDNKHLFVKGPTEIVGRSIEHLLFMTSQRAAQASKHVEGPISPDLYFFHLEAATWPLVDGC